MPDYFHYSLLLLRDVKNRVQLEQMFPHFDVLSRAERQLCIGLGLQIVGDLRAAMRAYSFAIHEPACPRHVTISASANRALLGAYHTPFGVTVGKSQSLKDLHNVVKLSLHPILGPAYNCEAFESELRFDSQVGSCQFTEAWHLSTGCALVVSAALFLLRAYPPATDLLKVACDKRGPPDEREIAQKRLSLLKSDGPRCVRLDIRRRIREQRWIFSGWPSL